MNEIENLLENESKKEYLNIEIPIEIDGRINNGIDKGKKIRRRIKISKITSIAASLILVLFISLVKVSPAFASFISDLPYMDKVVELINGDKSLENAIENEYMQYIGNYDEHEGLKVTVDSIIVDKSSIFIFYSIECEIFKYYDLCNIQLIDENGEIIYAHPSPMILDRRLGEGKKLYGKHSFTFDEDFEIPDKIFLSTKVRLGYDHDVFDNRWKIEIPIDKEKIDNSKEEYVLNKDIIIDDHKITINKVTVYPTRVLVDVSSDVNNSTEFYGLYNLRLIDENNEEFASIKKDFPTNGITVKDKLDGSGKIFYLYSSYFSNPESLTLKFDGIRILDKSKKYIEIDLEKEEMVSDDLEGITFKHITYYDKWKYNDRQDYYNDVILISFKTFNQNDELIWHIFSPHFTDSDGNWYQAKYISYSTSEVGFGIDKNTNYKGNIILEINDYPFITEKEISIKIK